MGGKFSFKQNLQCVLRSSTTLQRFLIALHLHGPGYRYKQPRLCVLISPESKPI